MDFTVAFCLCTHLQDDMEGVTFSHMEYPTEEGDASILVFLGLRVDRGFLMGLFYLWTPQEVCTV